MAVDSQENPDLQRDIRMILIIASILEESDVISSDVILYPK